jgi:hypothetical protein
MICLQFFFSFLLGSLFVLTDSNTPSTDTCETLYKSGKDVWLMGETLEAPFAAQLHAIFSYAPVTFVFQTHLVVGDLVIHEMTNDTRLSNDWFVTKKVPFSTFFDLNHFAWYWSQHGLKIISEKVHKNCFVVKKRYDDFAAHGRAAALNRYVHDLVNIARIPEFYPYAADEFRKLFYYTNTTSNSTFSFPFPDHTIVRVKSRFSMVGLYSFWNNLPMLQYVINSLKPAAPIEKLSQALVQLLPPNFVGVHLRVDDEAFLLVGSALESNRSSVMPSSSMGKKTENDQRVIRKIVQWIKKSSCLQRFFPSSSSSLSSSSSSSGPLSLQTLFLSTNAKPGVKTERRRVKKILEELTNLGFQNVLTRKILYDKYSRKKVQVAGPVAVANVVGSGVSGLHHNSKEVANAVKAAASASASGTNMDLSLIKVLSAEQLSFVDLLVLRASHCFVPSLHPSMASYVVARYRRFDKNIWDKYEEVNQENYGHLYTYRDCGW